AETDFVAKRTPMQEREFERYEKMFHQVHQELKEGKRTIRKFEDVEQNLKENRFYLLDGLLLYLESVDIGRDNVQLGENTRRRLDGRTRTIFENGILSNMLYRSLGKSLYSKGKLISEAIDLYTEDLFVNAYCVNEKDVQTGWIYVVKSKSDNPNISTIKDLYKIGFSTTSVKERIKNAKNEATYLFADVKIVATYKIYNRNADKLENLLHRFFANACLNLDLFDDKGQRTTPREWFVVPFDVIDEAINLILNSNIVNYEYDVENQKIKLRS
ncbi:MAG TPA: GIY-YIG nuclease family protein, partial [Campylobacterales bacterium]|nr:GIY-YIG nuclease family protein [Campylobacterales bacterium]